MKWITIKETGLFERVWDIQVESLDEVHRLEYIDGLEELIAHKREGDDEWHGDSEFEWKLSDEQ